MAKLRTFYIVLFLLIVSNYVNAQEFNFKYTKGLSIEIEKQHFKKAMESFNNIDSTTIKVIYKPLKSTGAARPSFFSFFKKPSKRIYKIYLNTKCKPNNLICYTNLSDSSKYGVIGHELSHIIDYNTMSSTQLIGFGFKYIFSKKFKHNTEHKIDSIAIMHGFGEQLYQFTNYIFSSENITERYKFKKEIYYMSPDSILKLHNKHFTGN